MIMTPQEFIELVIQGGAVAIAGLLIWVLYKVFVKHSQDTNKVIEKNNTVLEQNAKVITKHTEILDRLIRLLENKIAGK